MPESQVQNPALTVLNVQCSPDRGPTYVPQVTVPPVSVKVRGICILLPNIQRQRRTLHVQKDVLPYEMC